MPGIVLKEFIFDPDWAPGEEPPAATEGAGAWLLALIQDPDWIISPKFQARLMTKAKRSLSAKTQAVNPGKTQLSLRSEHKGRTRLKHKFSSKGVTYEEVA